MNFECLIELDAPFLKKTTILPVTLRTIRDSEATSTTKTIATPTEMIIIMRLFSLDLTKLT